MIPEAQKCASFWFISKASALYLAAAKCNQSGGLHSVSVRGAPNPLPELFLSEHVTQLPRLTLTTVCHHPSQWTLRSSSELRSLFPSLLKILRSKVIVFLFRTAHKTLP